MDGKGELIELNSYFRSLKSQISGSKSNTAMKFEKMANKIWLNMMNIYKLFIKYFQNENSHSFCCIFKGIILL